MTDFHDLIESDDLSPDEEARLRRTHELLLQAGPPPELSPKLLTPPTADVAVPELPFLPARRRSVLTFVLAAAVAAAAFGAGFLFGHGKAKPAVFAARHTLTMHGAGASALLRIAVRDSVGNWPMQMDVAGLPQQTNRRAYYELWLTRNGRPDEPCGQFRVHGHTTTIRFSVPWGSGGADGWVVTAQAPDTRGIGPIVLRT